MTDIRQFVPTLVHDGYCIDTANSLRWIKICCSSSCRRRGSEKIGKNLKNRYKLYR
jgi:hypothetical protein